VEKVAQNVGNVFNFQKVNKANNQTTGEKSSNLVTLTGEYNACMLGSHLKLIFGTD
jgi:hypothetical protein